MNLRRLWVFLYNTVRKNTDIRNSFPGDLRQRYVRYIRDTVRFLRGVEEDQNLYSSVREKIDLKNLYQRLPWLRMKLFQRDWKKFKDIIDISNGYISSISQEEDENRKSFLSCMFLVFLIFVRHVVFSPIISLKSQKDIKGLSGDFNFDLDLEVFRRLKVAGIDTLILTPDFELIRKIEVKPADVTYIGRLLRKILTKVEENEEVEIESFFEEDVKE